MYYITANYIRLIYEQYIINKKARIVVLQLAFFCSFFYYYYCYYYLMHSQTLYLSMHTRFRDRSHDCSYHHFLQFNTHISRQCITTTICKLYIIYICLYFFFHFISSIFLSLIHTYLLSYTHICNLHTTYISLPFFI